MHSSRILVFSTYPVRNPRHGGQFRAEALLSAYQQFGKVKYVAICNSAVYSSKDCSKWDIRVPGNLQQQIELSPSREPILIGQFATTDAELNGRIQEIISSYSPQIIVLEQPYLWPAVKLALELSAVPFPKIIYSSHNLEASHFYELSKINELSKMQTEFSQDQLWLEDVETNLAFNCDLIIATTNEDKIHYQKLNSSSQIALVNNGYSQNSSKISKKQNNAIHKKIKFENYALFVASAHTPNVQGFLDFIGTRLGFLPPRTGILIAGTAGPVIGMKAANRESRWLDLFWNRIQIWGFATEAELQIITDSASVVILPISAGGGSNLKTAQALQSGKPVIATGHSIRGFEFVYAKPILVQAKTESEFRDELTRFLSFSPANKPSFFDIDLNWNFDDLLVALKALMNE